MMSSLRSYIVSRWQKCCTLEIFRCFERHGRESWPKSGILPSTCTSSPQTTPSSTPTHSPRGRRRVRRPAVTQSISVSEIAAQTEANVAVDVSVQTVTHVAIQTEDRVETPAPTVTTPCSPSSLLSLSDACIQEQVGVGSAPMLTSYNSNVLWQL